MSVWKINTENKKESGRNTRKENGSILLIEGIKQARIETNKTSVSGDTKMDLNNGGQSVRKRPPTSVG